MYLFPLIFSLTYSNLKLYISIFEWNIPKMFSECSVVFYQID